MSWLKQLGFDPRSIGSGGSGWIPPEHRNEAMHELNRRVMQAMPSFGEVNTGDDLPDTCIFADLEVKATGKVLPRIWQSSGSCVGAGAWQAYLQAAIGDVVCRGDHEEIKAAFPWATYGVGRMLAGMRGTGEGSFGTAQAKAVSEWGMLPGDYAGLPAPEVRGDWLKWPAATEIAWSHPRNWPIAKAELDPVADAHEIQATAQVRTTTELARGAAQGFGITLASMFGTSNERVIDGFLIADWNDQWAHQMSCGGYATHPRLGRIWWIQNQWGPNAHPVCPTMSARGVRGGFWIADRTMSEIIARGEVFVHSNTKGFPVRKIEWGTMGIV